jgi:hypothetical protein
VVWLDAGDFTGDPGAAGEKQTEALIDGMNRIGYLAGAFGPREMNHGWDAFQARQKRLKFPLVSANIVWQDTAAPVVQPYIVVKAALRHGSKNKEVRIGVMGLTAMNPTFLKTGPNDRRMVTIDPVAAAQKYATELRAKCDVAILLSTLDLDGARNLARKVKDFDLILGTNGAMQTRPDDFPEDSQFGRTRLQYIGDQGKNLGEVRLNFGDKRAIQLVTRNVVGLTREWPDDPVLAKLMEDTKVAINDMHRAQAEADNPFAAAPTPAPAPAAGAPGGAVAVIPGNAQAPMVLSRGGGAAWAYTGSQRCQPCHEKEFAVWSKSKHAHAFDILEKVHQDFNPTCVGCHTIGNGQTTGFVNARSTPGLKHVGCEACHGASSRHPDQVGAGYGVVSTGDCVSCHTKDNSPDYDPEVYIPQVQHWGETQAAH